MSREDAPNLRSIDRNSCDTCKHYAIDYGIQSYKIICRKYNFTIVNTRDLVCDGWEKEK